MTTLTVDTQAKQSPGVRELSLREVEQVGGGFTNNQWISGATTIAALSVYSPVTAAFGLPIAASMYYLGTQSW